MLEIVTATVHYSLFPISIANDIKVANPANTQIGPVQLLVERVFMSLLASRRYLESELSAGVSVHLLMGQHLENAHRTLQFGESERKGVLNHVIGFEHLSNGTTRNQ